MASMVKEKEIHTATSLGMVSPATAWECIAKKGVRSASP